MTIIRAESLVSVPWKNGGGTTRVIATDRENATLDDFHWRVSIAQVDTASPFSVFPGIDRTIVLLNGAGFHMTLDGKERHALTTPYEPFEFAGESRVDIELAGGPTQDFNLMTRRPHARGFVAVCAGNVTLSASDSIALAYLVVGEAHVDGVLLQPGDSWRPTTEAAIRLGEGALAIVAHVA
ncbi:hypothetical protein FHW69_000761 [Luteibacter sp. Sphag1AF]|uniref:HutD/Ves family protein n=1 Tax=Luteibacter sp. Sphag1AF TaxID=2587031 RepID=UPI00162263FC|nr:HutD family protein [Luteibacter sp. Sphag1AF]MBB3226171.1 hypothetical protein [Luteibacter sp. Sphag1AF]